MSIYLWEEKWAKFEVEKLHDWKEKLLSNKKKQTNKKKKSLIGYVQNTSLLFIYFGLHSARFLTWNKMKMDNSWKKKGILN